MAYFSAASRRLSQACRVALMGLLVCLSMVMGSAQAEARAAFELNASKQPIALAPSGEYWIDTQSQLSADQVDSSTALTWLPTPERGIYPLKPRQTLWIRFTVPPTQDVVRWGLEIPYPALDRASLYTKDRTGQFMEQRAGDLTPVNKWLTPHRYPLLVLAFQAEAPTMHLLRLENAQGFSAPIRFVNDRYVLRSEQQISLFLGVYFGIAALGCVIGLIGFVWLRDRAYLYYTVTSGLVGFTLAALTGVAALHLWPNSPNWADRSLTVMGTGALVVFILLNATVVSLAERSKRLNRLVWAIAVIGLVLVAMLGVTDSALRLKLVVPYLLLVIVAVLSINLWAWRHGDRFGGWLLLSAAPFAITWGIAIARYLEWIPLSFATEQGGLASMVFQLPALLTVLVSRSQRRRENRRRIMGLDRIDPATGLITEQVFSERLLRMGARSQRLGHRSVAVLIDIINTEQTLRDFGRKAADELPLRVASRLLSTVRDIDSVARLSERRFGMLVEGPISSEEAATLGPRIIARCLMPFKGMPTECVAQVRLAYALVPLKNVSSQSLMSRLDERLTTASNADDKRAIFTL